MARLSILPVVLLLGGCATAQPGPEPSRSTPSLSSEDCLYSIGIEGWAPVDQETFVIYGPGRQDAFVGKLAIPSVDLTLNFVMVFVDDDRNGRICGQSADSVAFRDGNITRQKVFITSLRKITRKEADAMVTEAKDGKDKAKDRELQGPQQSAETPAATR